VVGDQPHGAGLDLGIDLLGHGEHPSNSERCGIKPGALHLPVLVVMIMTSGAAKGSPVVGSRDRVRSPASCHVVWVEGLTSEHDCGGCLQGHRIVIGSILLPQREQACIPQRGPVAGYAAYGYTHGIAFDPDSARAHATCGS